MSDVASFKLTFSCYKALYLETLSSLNGIFLQITQRHQNATIIEAQKSPYSSNILSLIDTYVIKRTPKSILHPHDQQ
ncbi:hypothetical protein Hanom_Chr05g00398381 [Helianthus anomalus]